MKLFLTRHGETDWNKKSLIQGKTDIPLNEKGLEQAKKLAEKLKDVRIDVIFSSTLDRSYQTAKAVADSKGLEVIRDPRIIEASYGFLEGGKRLCEDHVRLRKNFASRYPGGGESYLQLSYRIYSFIEDIKRKYPDKNVLVVAHGGIARVFNSYFFDMSNEEFVCFGLDNCEVREYDL